MLFRRQLPGLWNPGTQGSVCCPDIEDVVFVNSGMTGSSHQVVFSGESRAVMDERATISSYLLKNSGDAC